MNKRVKREMNRRVKRKRGGPSEPYFDDCPVCRVMKKAEREGRSPTGNELLQAMQEAENKGAVVGGPLYDGFKKSN